MEKKVFFNTTVSEELIKEFKILAIRLGKRQNQLLEEAILELLKKHDPSGYWQSYPLPSKDAQEQPKVHEEKKAYRKHKK